MNLTSITALVAIFFCHSAKAITQLELCKSFEGKWKQTSCDSDDASSFPFLEFKFDNCDTLVIKGLYSTIYTPLKLDRSTYYGYKEEGVEMWNQMTTAQFTRGIAMNRVPKSEDPSLSVLATVHHMERPHSSTTFSSNHNYQFYISNKVNLEVRGRDYVNFFQHDRIASKTNEWMCKF